MKRLWLVLLVLCAGLAHVDTAHAAAPSNDDFANATPAGLGSASAELANASVEPGEPLPSCLANVSRTVWYRIDPPLTELTNPGSPAAVQISPNPRLFIAGAAVALYRGDSLANLVPLAYGANYHLGGQFSQANYARAAAWRNPGEHLYVQIAVPDGETHTTFDVSFGAAASGDDHRMPLRLTPLSKLRAESTGLDLGNATIQPDDTAPRCATLAPNVWLSLPTVQSANVSVHVRGSDITNGFFAVFRIDGGQRVELACFARQQYSPVDVLLHLDSAATYEFELASQPVATGYPTSDEIDVTPAD